jgi:hypothetical protein
LQDRFLSLFAARGAQNGVDRGTAEQLEPFAHRRAREGTIAA